MFLKNLAACEGHLNVVRFLVETCDVDVTLKDRWGNTALEEAKDFAQEKIITYLDELILRRSEEGDTIAQS